MRAWKPFLALLGVCAAFAVGRSTLAVDPLPSAHAGPTWDRDRTTWVDSYPGGLLQWRMDGDKVVDVTLHYLSTEPAVYEVKEKDGKSTSVETFPAGNYVFTRKYKPAPEGMPEPSLGSLEQRLGGRASTAAPAPAPAPPAKPAGGQMSCGAGKCG